jgi:hypothetical protein
VQVIDNNGKQGWKKPGEVLLTDTICTGKDGKPVVMSGKPGRPAKVKLLPATAQIAEQMKAKEKALESDEILQSVRGTPDSDDVLNHIIGGLAEEAASMRFEREEAERHGVETSKLSVRRVDALKKTADVWLKRREQVAAKSMDLDGPAFQAVFGLIMETFREALEESGMRPEMRETVFTKLGKKLDESWKAEAKARMKEV